MGTLLVLVVFPGNVNAIANIWVPDLGKMSNLPYRCGPQVKPHGAFPEITSLFSKVSRKCVHTGHAWRKIIHHFPTTVKAVFTWGGYSLKVTSYL